MVHAPLQDENVTVTLMTHILHRQDDDLEGSEHQRLPSAGAIQKNVRVTKQLGHQLTGVGRGINKNCSMSANRNWKRGVAMNVSNIINPMMSKFLDDVRLETEAGESTSVVGNLEFLSREYRGADLEEDAQDRVAASICIRPNVHQENSWRIVRGSSPDHFGLATANDADDSVGKVFFNDIRWMSHVDLGSGILPCKGIRGQLRQDAETRNAKRSTQVHSEPPTHHLSSKRRSKGKRGRKLDLPPREKTKESLGTNGEGIHVFAWRQTFEFNRS